MEKKFTMVLCVIVGVILGVVIGGKQSKESLLNELLKQQNEMLRSQYKMEGVLSVTSRSAGWSASGSNLSSISLKNQELEQRLAKLDNQLKELATAIDGRAQGGRGVQQAKGSQRQGPPPEDFSKVYDIPAAHSPILGNPDAPVTIVAFDDYQCPFCSRFHPPILEALKAYPDKVNFMIKNFPLSFHPQAKPATKAVLAAGEQGKYFEMADAILANNRDLSDERFKQEAEKLGLDVDQFMKDYKEKDAQWEDIIQKDLALGQKVGVRGTPSFYINGKKSRSRDIGSWKREIDQILNNKPSSAPKGSQRGGRKGS